MWRRTEREEACCSVFSRVPGPCVKAATVVVCSSGCVVVVGSVGARELGLVGVGSVSQFVLQTWDWSFPFCPSSRVHIECVRHVNGALPALASSLLNTDSIDGGPPTATRALCGVRRSNDCMSGLVRPATGTNVPRLRSSFREISAASVLAPEEAGS